MEFLLFWLEVEQYRSVEGEEEDMRGYAEVLKGLGMSTVLWELY